MASNIVGIELSKPIDISEMQVQECSFTPIDTADGLRFERNSEMRTRTDDGDEIIISITRISQKRPDKISE
jgi:hypothetical protein